MIDFPYSYTGGGYYRLKGIPKGELAPMLHGMDAIKEAMRLQEEATRAEMSAPGPEHDLNCGAHPFNFFCSCHVENGPSEWPPEGVCGDCGNYLQHCACT